MSDYNCPAPSSERIVKNAVLDILMYMRFHDVYSETLELELYHFLFSLNNVSHEHS